VGSVAPIREGATRPPPHKLREYQESTVSPPPKVKVEFGAF